MCWDKPGCDAVVIPHNANLSGGLMFETARHRPERAGGAGNRAGGGPAGALEHPVRGGTAQGGVGCDNRSAVWARR